MSTYSGQKKQLPELTARIGIIGTGFIATGLIHALRARQGLCVTRVMTRRPISRCPDAIPQELLTHSVQEVIDHADIVVECSGDVIHATAIVAKVLAAHIPVVTMDSEFHVTTGSYFVGKGLLTEAEGDQPGSLAALREDAVEMGFEPVVYGNLKRYINLDPNLQAMQYWAAKQGISLPQVTAFTDGTKVQIEQAFVANGLGATIAHQGLCGIPVNDINQGAIELAERADAIGEVISDYLLCPNAPAGVFIVARHNTFQRNYLNYLKLGEGPYYVLQRPFHLCHLEILKTIRKVLTESRPLLDNSSIPRISVAALPKRALRKGEVLIRGIGSFDVRGEAVKIQDVPAHVPIGLVSNARIMRSVEPNSILSWDDVELPPSSALDAWFAILEQVKKRAP